MNVFGGRTLRQKLALVLWGTALCAFASSGIALAVFQGLTLERRARAIMEPYADLVAVGTDAAVAFRDPVRAQEILDGLRATPEILSADIVLEDGRVLAHLGGRLDASQRVSTPGVYLGAKQVELVRDLQRGAMLHLNMSLGQLRRQTRQTLWLFGAAVVALLAITVGQFLVLQRTLVKPIAMLTQAAELVRNRGEYGQRVSASGTDEVARLGRTFNAMMQAIEERESELRRLVESNIIGIFFWNLSGAITQANDALLDIVGYSREDLLSGRMNWADMTPPEHRDADERAIAEIRATGSCRPYEKEFLHRDGHRVPVLLGGTLFEHSGSEGVAFVLDLTERREAEAKATAYEIERKRAEALAELDHAKTAFFSNVSHEFRTPLTLALGPLEALLDAGEGALPAGARQQLAMAHRNCLRLLRLVNALLDFSRIEAGRAQASYRPTDLARFTADLVSSFHSACEQAGLQLIVDCPPLPAPVHVDPDMWEKIVLNLVSNAFKFTLAGEIEVKLRAVGERCELSVRDTGVGIPEAELPHVFERFHRVERSRGRTLEGTGIGLALVQELAKLHGGSVRVESALGRGSTFTVAVPFGTAHLPAERIAVTGEHPPPTGSPTYVEEALRWAPEPVLECSPARERRPGEPRPLVLLADDNADMREYVRSVLEQRYEVEAVADGQVALEAARRRRPALVLTDVMMPRLDGVALLRALRGDPGLRTVPVILLSALAGEESRVGGLEAGADDYLVKPFSARELLARVTTNVELARAREEAEHERAARAAAEEAERRSALLAEAGSLLSESLDYGQTLTRLGDFCVKSLADWCVLDLVEGGELRRLAGACADPGKEPLLSRLRERYPARRDSPHPAARALRAGEPVWVPAFTDEQLRGMCEDDEHFEIVRALGTRSAVVVPLVARGKALGVLSLGSGTPGRYARTDLELVKEVAHRAGIAIDNARLHGQTQRAVRLRDEFLLVASHELRTPLTPLTMSLRTLQRWQRSERRELPAAISESVELAARQGDRLKKLINEMLEVSRMGNGRPKLDLSEVDLEAVVRAVAARFEPELARAGCPLSVRCDGPVTGRWDASKLDQVVTSLLSNAIKFGAGGPIEMSLAEEGGKALLSVRDHGIGIDPAHQARIFERFERAVSAKNYGGLGLGLYISRATVEAHGGTIKVESQPGAGSSFTVEIPCAGPPRAPAQPKDPEHAGAA
jgi:PAS domain S-box-containing protein